MKMIYLNSKHINESGLPWDELLNTIENAVQNLEMGDYSQPLKPYLRFKDPSNRIIAMPAYLGGDFDFAGLKWISSFPKNIQRGIQRAHSVSILNDATTGKPIAILNTTVVSAIRTAAVTGLIIREFDKVRGLQDDIQLGIVGFGPIGQMHLRMVDTLWGEKIGKIHIYDINGIKPDLIPNHLKEKINVVRSYEEAYCDADVFMTCTVSAEGYIDKRPKDSALLLNISLRDFKPEILDYTSLIIVDDWDEVCREKTDIEIMHLKRGLKKSDTYNICDIVIRGVMNNFPKKEAVLFNPMGMAIFDLAIATYYYRRALDNHIGFQLEE